MEINAFKELLERQARERAELAQRLDESRPERAWRAARAEQEQPVPPHPSGITPQRPPLEALVKRHEHNLNIQDQQQLAALGQKHAAERAPIEQEPTQAFERTVKQGVHSTENELPFYEDSQPPSPEHQIKR